MDESRIYARLAEIFQDVFDEIQSMSLPSFRQRTSTGGIVLLTSGSYLRSKKHSKSSLRPQRSVNLKTWETW